jgi:hypothetical protein
MNPAVFKNHSIMCQNSFPPKLNQEYQKQRNAFGRSTIIRSAKQKRKMKTQQLSA